MSVGHRSVRPAAVAGAFYPADPDALRDALGLSFAGAVVPPPGAAEPVALIVPHAGLAYSGPVAASAYLRLAPIADAVERVVLLGPSHRLPLRGLAASSADAFVTPLGPVSIDRVATERLCALPAVTVDDGAHALEHSLEVQLPFLQSLLGEFELVPLAVGDAGPAEVAAVLAAVWSEPDTLIVVSTDLSHYHAYDEASRLDRRTAAAIRDRRGGDIADLDACGARPLRGLLRTATERHLTVEQLDLRSSGDTAGDRDRVVGYGAFALS